MMDITDRQDENVHLWRNERKTNEQQMNDICTVNKQRIDEVDEQRMDNVGMTNSQHMNNEEMNSNSVTVRYLLDKCQTNNIRTVNKWHMKNMHTMCEQTTFGC